MPWSAAAAGLLTRVVQTEYMRLKSKVEKEAVLARSKQVDSLTYYGSTYLLRST